MALELQASIGAKFKKYRTSTWQKVKKSLRNFEPKNEEKLRNPSFSRKKHFLIKNN